jgi:GT2 family glycosyltransferase
MADSELDRESTMLGYIHGGTVRAEFMTSVLALTSSAPIGAVRGMTCGARVPLARNLLVDSFLASPLSWLWCVDTDMVFSPGTLDRLLAVADPRKRPIVSALCFMLIDGKPVASMYRRAPEEMHSVVPFVPYTKWAPGTLLQVKAVGAGCVLIHRSVLEKIQKEHDGELCWFREIVRNHVDVGEDLSFCLRAEQAGFPIWCHSGVEVGHVKPVTVRPFLTEGGDAGMLSASGDLNGV